MEATDREVAIAATERVGVQVTVRLQIRSRREVISDRYLDVRPTRNLGRLPVTDDAVTEIVTVTVTGDSVTVPVMVDSDSDG